MELPHFTACYKCSKVRIILHSVGFFFFLQSEDNVLNRSGYLLTVKKQEDGPSAEQDIALGSYSLLFYPICDHLHLCLHKQAFRLC